MSIAIIMGSVAAVGTALSVIFLPDITVKGKKIPFFWVISFITAILAVVLGAISAGDVWSGLTADMWSMLEGRVSVNPIKILVLFFSMTAISVFLDETGALEYLASRSVKLAGKSQKRLFFTVFFVVSLLTVFTSNDVVILTFTPFLCYFCKNAKVSPMPYVVTEFVAANTFSMIFIIGNPTNIYLAESYGMTFFEYFSRMAIPSVLGGAAALGTLYLIFRKQLSMPLSEENFSITRPSEPRLAIISAVILVACLVGLVTSDYVGIESWAVALVSMIILLIISGIYYIFAKKKPFEIIGTLKRLPYQLIPFVLAMFVIVLTLKNNGVTAAISDLLSDVPEQLDILVYGTSSAVIANLVNNIPMSVFYSAIQENSSPYAVYAAVVGSNVGAFFTPVGALAGIMFTGLLKNLDVKMSFFDFVKYGTAVAVPTLLASIGGLYISYLIF